MISRKTVSALLLTTSIVLILVGIVGILWSSIPIAYGADWVGVGQCHDEQCIIDNVPVGATHEDAIQMIGVPVSGVINDSLREAVDVHITSFGGYLVWYKNGVVTAIDRIDNLKQTP